MKKLYMILPLALILCFMVGCQDKAAMAELEEFRAQAEVEEQNKEIVRKGLKLFDEANIEGAMELLAPNCLWYNPSNSPAPMSNEELRELLVMLFNTFSEWNSKIEDIIAAGDKVIARMHEKQGEKLLAACDDDLLGKKLEGGSLYLHVSEGFYGSEAVTREELNDLMDSCTIGNLVGDNVIAMAVEKKLVHEDRILKISGVPHAQFARMPKPGRR